MTSPKFIDHEITLLFAKYGRDNVLNALARHLDSSRKDIDALFNELKNGKAKPRPRTIKPEPHPEVLADIISRYPLKEEQLQALNDRFLKKTFLPERRDVRNFFERHRQDLGRVPTRAKALPKLLNLLAQLDLSELDELCNAPDPDEYSSLAIISEAILGANR